MTARVPASSGKSSNDREGDRHELNIIDIFINGGRKYTNNMDLISRRKLAASVAIAVGVSGCISGDSDVSRSLNSLHIVNMDTATHTVQISVSDSKKELYSERHELEPSSEGHTKGREIDKEWPDDVAKIDLTAKIVDEQTTANLDFSNIDGGKYDVDLIIKSRNNMSFWYRKV